MNKNLGELELPFSPSFSFSFHSFMQSGTSALELELWYGKEFVINGFLYTYMCAYIYAVKQYVYFHLHVLEVSMSRIAETLACTFQAFFLIYNGNNAH